MKQLASAIGSALLLAGFALFTSQSAIAQVPPKPDHTQLGNFEWESTTGSVVIQYERDHESLIVRVYINGGSICPRESSTSNSSDEQFLELVKASSERLMTVAKQLKVWILTDDGGALVRSKGQGLEDVGEVGNACEAYGIVPFTFKWTPSMRISAVVLKVGDRNYLLPVTAN